MSEEGTKSPESDGVLRRALRWWGTAGAFALGLLVGAVVVGLVAGGSPVPPANGPGAAATSAGGGSAAPTAGQQADATGELVVNAACLRAVNAAQDTVDVVDDLGEALAGFNAARLDEVVRRLQPLQRRLQDNVEECEAEGRLPSAPSAAPTASGSEDGSTSTASPTD